MRSPRFKDTEAIRRFPAITLRIPPARLESWRELHARTYHIHRLSFPAWLIDRANAAIRDGNPYPLKIKETK